MCTVLLYVSEGRSLVVNALCVSVENMSVNI